MDDITREKLKKAFEPMFGPHFVDAVEAVLHQFRNEREESAAFYTRSPVKHEPLQPLITENGVELTVKIRRDKNGVYYVVASESYMGEKSLGPIHIMTQAMSALDAIVRMAPQLGEAIAMAESIHECEQINRRHEPELDEP